MFRHRLFAAIAGTWLVLVPMVSHAQTQPWIRGLNTAAEGTGLTNVCGTSEPGACIATIVGRAVQVLLGLLGIVLFVLLIYAGFLWMTAGGDTKKVTEARTMIVNAVAGMAVIAVSYAVASFILGQLAFVATGTEATPSGGAAGGATDICSAPGGFDCDNAYCRAAAGRPGCEDYDRCCRS